MLSHAKSFCKSRMQLTGVGLVWKFSYSASLKQHALSLQNLTYDQWESEFQEKPLECSSSVSLQIEVARDRQTDRITLNDFWAFVDLETHIFLYKCIKVICNTLHFSVHVNYNYTSYQG